VIFLGYYNVEPLRTEQEINEFRSALYELGGDRNKFLFTLGINTGLRISDLVKLKVHDIYGKPYTDLLEKKTKKKRRLHLVAIQGDIVEYCVGMQPDDFLFKSKKTDNHISTTQAYRILVAAGEWIGRKDIGTHTMRKTFGYHYYKKTKDVYTLMEIFGHAAPTITKKYIGIREDEIADSLKDFRL
jgi:integrase